MNSAAPTSALSPPAPAWTIWCFRAARLFVLTLLIILPWEGVTAARETALIGAAFFGLAYVIFTPGEKLRLSILALPLAFYALAAIASVFSAVDPAYSLRELRAELLKGLGAFLIGYNLVSRRLYLEQAWGALLAGAAIMALAGPLYFFWEGGSLFSFQVRAGSLHNGYGGLGTYLVTVWPLVMAAPLAFPRPRLKLLWAALIFLNLFVLYLTFNRAAWLAVLAQGFLFLVLMSRRRLRVALAGALVCLAVLAALFFMPGARHGERWSQLLTAPHKVGGTTGDLLKLWSFALDQLAQRPLRAIGLGRHSFSKAFPDFRRTHPALLWHSHNMFIETALQLGVQGLGALLLVLVVLVAVLWPHAPPARGDSPSLFCVAVLVMVVGFCLRNLTDDFFCDDSAIMFWLLAGLGLGARRLRQGGTLAA